MKNILSTSLPITGKELKDWIQSNLSGQTSHTKEAKQLERYLNADDNSMYKVVFRPRNDDRNADTRPYIRRVR